MSLGSVRPSRAPWALTLWTRKEPLMLCFRKRQISPIVERPSQARDSGAHPLTKAAQSAYTTAGG
eukprot:3221657-Pyramimonas_sp.AAC.1